MGKVLFYGKPLAGDLFSRILPEAEVKILPTKRDFALAIIDETDIIAVFISHDPMTREDRNLIESICAHFPLLKVGLLARDLQMPKPTNLTLINISAEENVLTDNIRIFISAGTIKNRREFNRFNWILNGYLRVEEDEKKYEIHSFSAGGAYLKSSGVPEAGKRGEIRVMFKNTQMTAACEILEPRNASSNLPYGFPVRFLSLSPDSQILADRIVNDALYKLLINPPMEPAIPTLDEDQLTEDFMSF